MMLRVVGVGCALLAVIAAGTAVAAGPGAGAAGAQAACRPGFGPPVWVPGPVLATRDGFAGHAEPALAVDPRDPGNLLGAAQFVVPGSFTRVPGTFYSTDAGRTWHDNGALPLPAGYEHGDDVSTAFTGGTGLVAAEIARPDGYGGVFAWRTTDGGRRFSVPVPVSAVPAHTDHPWLAVTGGPDGHPVVIVAWNQGPFLMASRSTDGGQTFTAPRVISAPADQHPDLAVVIPGPGQVVSVVYAAAPAGGRAEAIHVVTSHDAGLTFSAPVTVPGALATQGAQPYEVSLIGAAANPRTGTRYVAFAEQAGQPVRLHVVITHDTRGGTWAAPVPVAPAISRHAGDQFQPSVAVDGDGRVLVTYFAASTGQVAEFATQPGGRGRTWQLGSPFDPGCGLTAGVKHVPWLGDYQALASAAGRMYAARNDGGTGHLQILVQRISCEASES